MEDETAGDPETGLKWTKKTTQKISDELKSIGIEVSKNTVGKLLKEMDFSLRVNCKKNSNGDKKPTAEENKDTDSKIMNLGFSSLST